MFNSFPSWRHFVNSNLRSLVTNVDLQKLIGHRTLAMTEHYDRETEFVLARLRPHQENLVGIGRGSVLSLIR